MCLETVAIRHQALCDAVDDGSRGYHDVFIEILEG
jgi:hypothetical protein